MGSNANVAWRPLPRAACHALALLALFASPAAGQLPQLETFSVRAGLPSALILDLDQDPSGRLWVLSRVGITVYDGHEFVTQRSTDGLPSTLFVRLEVDARGRVWTVERSPLRVHVLTRRGSTWHSLSGPAGSPPPAGPATALAVVSQGARNRVFIGTDLGGLRIWEGEVHAAGPATGRWSYLEVPSGHVHTLAASGAALAVGTGAGLCFLAQGELDCRSREIDRRLAEPILALAVTDSPQRLVVLGPSWLGRLDLPAPQRGGTGDARFTLLADGLHHRSFEPLSAGSLAVDPAGGVYFGSPAGLGFLDPATGETRAMGRREGLDAEGVAALLVDREANVWVGGLSGLARIESRRFLSYTAEQGLLEDEVTALVELSPGRYVLGHNVGLTRLDERSGDPVFETFPFDVPPSAPLNAYRVLDLAVAPDGTVWAAAGSMGIVELRARRQILHPLPGRAFSVMVDADGRLWAASGRMIFRRDGDRFVQVDTGDGVPGYIRRFFPGPDGRLFLATHQGLSWYEAGGWQHAVGPGEASNSLYNVLAEPTGEVWVGTADGLYELRGKELRKVKRGALEISRPIYFILKDPGGRFWFGTDDGVLRWDGAELRHLTLRHGLAGRETNRSAGLIDHRGRVWIGTEQGVSIYQEPYDFPPTAPPGVEIAALEVNGETQTPGADLELDHRRNNLSFHVRTVSFSRQSEILHRYRLEGFETRWNGPAPLSAHEIRYPNLPPGRYHLRVAAGWDAGDWSAEAVSATILINAPLWRRPWFYLLSTAAAAVALFGAHQLRTRTILRRSRELESLNHQLNTALAERQDLVGELEVRNAELERFTYTVSHDLKSPLVTVHGFLGLLEKDTAAGDTDRMKQDIARVRDAATKMGRLLGELLELSRVGRVVGPPEEIRLDDLVREASELVHGAIGDGVGIRIAPGLPAVRGDRLRLLEVCQNLIENAVRYRGEEPQLRIEVGVRFEGGERIFYVADNGMGIKPEYHDKIFGLFERLDQESDGTGVGLALVKRIVEFHGGRVWVESDGPGRGSTFCFTLAETPSPAVGGSTTTEPAGPY